jgi:hypothetical protein
VNGFGPGEKVTVEEALATGVPSGAVRLAADRVGALCVNGDGPIDLPPVEDSVAIVVDRGSLEGGRIERDRIVLECVEAIRGRSVGRRDESLRDRSRGLVDEAQCRRGDNARDDRSSSNR